MTKYLIQRIDRLCRILPANIISPGGSKMRRGTLPLHRKLLLLGLVVRHVSSLTRSNQMRQLRLSRFQQLPMSKEAGQIFGREKTQKTQKGSEIEALRIAVNLKLAMHYLFVCLCFFAAMNFHHHYLRASGIEHGLLINFGGGKFEIRKFILSRKE